MRNACRYCLANADLPAVPDDAVFVFDNGISACQNGKRAGQLGSFGQMRKVLALREQLLPECALQAKLQSCKLCIHCRNSFPGMPGAQARHKILQVLLVLAQALCMGTLQTQLQFIEFLREVLQALSGVAKSCAEMR